MTSKSLKPILLSVGVITMSLAVNFAFAWTEPAGAPPSGNVSAPVNVSSTGQTKAGALTVQGNFTAPIFYDGNDAAYYVNPAGQTILAGSVGIGTGITTPTNTLQVKDLINFPSSTYGTFLGYQAGNVNTGNSNSAVGYQSLYSNTSGLQNSAVGYQSLYTNTTGGSNSALGAFSLYSNTGNYNSALGGSSLFSNTTGGSNSAMGYQSLRSNSTGSYNSALGSYSLYSNSIGHDNSAMGYYSLYSNSTGNLNSAVGSGSLYSNTTGGSNSALGYRSLFSNAEGNYNSALGRESLYYNTSGAQNSAVGSGSLNSNSTGSYNSALGSYSLLANATGNNNVALGYSAGRYETGSNAFYIDNQDRGSSVNDKSKALMYGTFDANPVNQTLAINANVNVVGNLTVNGSPVGGGGTNYWTQSGTTLVPSTTSWQPMFGSTANSANYPYAAMISSKGVAGSATGALLGIAGEALSDGTKNASGILGIGKASGAYSGKGIEGAGYVAASADTAGAYGGYFYADSTHSGGINVGGYGYANYSSNENYGLRGVAVTPSTGATYVTIGAYGKGTTYGSTSATGIYGRGSVAATGDTAGAYGGIFYSSDTHAGGNNYGIYSHASGGASNYSFYGSNGVLFNWGNVGIGMGRSAPVYALDVIRTVPNVARFTSTGTGASPDVLIVDQDSDNTRAALQIQGNGGSSEVLFASSGGNIGIGTTVPAGALDLGTATGGRALSWGGTAGNYANIWTTYGSGDIVLATGMKGTTATADGYLSSAAASQGRAAIRINAYTGTGGSLHFFTDADAAVAVGGVVTPTERMTIDYLGNVGIGTTTPGQPLSVYTNTDKYALMIGDNIHSNLKIAGTAVGANGYSLLQTWITNGETAGGNLVFQRDGGNVGIGLGSPGYKLTVNGQPAANGYTAFTNYSDSRLKTNIESLSDGYLDRLMQIRPSTFNYNALTGYDEATRERRVTGLIAQDLRNIFPEMVGTTTINGTEYLDTNLSALPLYTIKAIQEQQKEIEYLKAEIEQLKSKIK
ncbi:MAG: tail fiber domain-containing protein [Candidatus Paceibacterota bacterium]